MRTLLLAFALLSVGPGAAFADSGQGTTAERGAPYDADELSERGFVAVERPAGDRVPGGPFMLAAYISFIALLGAYVVQLTLRHRTAQAELAALRRALEDVDDKVERLRRRE